MDEEGDGSKGNGEFNGAIVMDIRTDEMKYDDREDDNPSQEDSRSNETQKKHSMDNDYHNTNEGSDGRDMPEAGQKPQTTGFLPWEEDLQMLSSFSDKKVIIVLLLFK